MNPHHSPQFPFELPPGVAVPGDEMHPLSRRCHPEPPHPYRAPFVRDVGRILHANAFRRLAGKTQVFTRRAAVTDHSRSRLTHTLEVAQIARILAAALGLNAPLAEALALAHDIGHSPFGHAGESALDSALREHGLNFDHNLQALRIVTRFEERNPAYPGLNLTLAVREGIVKHSRDYTAASHPELEDYFLDQRPPLEAQIIDLADEIAYLTADMEDGLAAGILRLEELRQDVALFSLHLDTAEREFPQAEPRLLSNVALKQMLNALVTDLMRETENRVRSHNIQSLAEVRRFSNRLAALSRKMETQRKQAKDFLYARLYLSPALQAEHTHAAEVVHTLFEAWTRNPDLLPPAHQARIDDEGLPRAVADYIAGMTDAYIDQAWLHLRSQRGF